MEGLFSAECCTYMCMLYLLFGRKLCVVEILIRSRGIIGAGVFFSRRFKLNEYALNKL